jgi:hypothetical protein
MELKAETVVPGDWRMSAAASDSELIERRAQGAGNGKS